MGSGLGSGLDRLWAAAGGVLSAAAVTGTADHRAVLLAEVESAWVEQDDGRRIVFVTGA